MKKKLLSLLLALTIISAFSIPSTVYAEMYENYRITYTSCMVGDIFTIPLRFSPWGWCEGSVQAYSSNPSAVTVEGFRSLYHESEVTVYVTCTAVGTGSAEIYLLYNGSIRFFASIPKEFWGIPSGQLSSTDKYIISVSSYFSVLFDSNNGSDSVDIRQVELNKQYDYHMGEFPTPTWAGYTFNGWYTESVGGTRVMPTDTYTICGDQTLYAHWIRDEYMVYFDPNGGSTPEEYRTVINGQTYGDLPVPTRTGYTFAGWFTEADGGTQVTSDTVVEITAAQTLYAHWEANSYTVTFNANGGKTTVTSMSVSYGSAYGTLPEPTRTGYIFKGWFTATSGGTHITDDTIVTATSAQTLYAKWTARKYTVTFDAKGGSTPTASKKVSYYSTYGTLPTPTKSGNTFLGWFTELNGGTKVTSETKVRICDNQTLYAKWERNVYTILYDLNGAYGEISSQDFAIGTNAVITSERPTRDGFRFIGWARTNNALNAEFKPSDTFPGNEDTTLYAVWKILASTNTTIINTSAYPIYNISVTNAEIGNKILIATYKDGKLEDLQIESYEGENILFETIKPFEAIKVMVWDDMSNVEPLSKVETVGSVECDPEPIVESDY